MKRRLGRYELREALRPGAVGTIWEAWDDALARRVAVEIVPLSPGGELMARFQQEAQVAGKLPRAGLVQVYDVGQDSGDAYIVREFVDGESLRQSIDRIGVLPVARAVAIMLGVLETLDACHRVGIVHREIMPRNILLPGGDRVKLAGFGVAAVQSVEATMTGTAWDTEPYVSPEQITDRSPIDARSDLWSCGVVLYEMLTGRHPFRGATPATTGQAIVHDDPEPPSHHRPDLPPALDEAILRTLRKSAPERFPSAATFADALRAATAVTPEPVAVPAKRPLPRRAALLGAAAAVALIAGLAVWLGSGREAPITAAAPPIPEQSLAQRVLAIPCSTVSVTEAPAGSPASLQGIVGSGTPRSALDAIASGSVSAAVREFPSSPTACRMAEIVRANAGPSPGRLVLQGGGAPLRTGDDIRVRLRAPAFDGEVRLEDLDGQGQVQHVMAANLGAALHFTAAATIGLGRKGDDLIGRVTDGSGTEMLVAVMTAAPLFAQARPITEAGGAYLDALEQALAALRRQGTAVSMDAIVLTTARPGK